MSGAGDQTVRVGLPSRAYDVRVGAGLLASLGEGVRNALPGESTGETPAPPKHVKRAFLAHDANVPEALVETARESLASAEFDVADAALEASEETKSLDTLARLLEAMAGAKLERSEPVVALGGGVIGDVAGFAASVYRRGVPVVQCPTTLLAMVDASVGGKTGVNLRAGGALRKNMVGAFWQPALVLCDVAALDSLPERHMRAGLGECVKHALLAHSTPARDRLKLAREDELFEWTLRALPRALAREREALVELIARNVAVKASLVEADEREEADDETGGRALLNLGHTFAHAIETLPGLTPTGGSESRPTGETPHPAGCTSHPLPQGERRRKIPLPRPLSQRERGEETPHSQPLSRGESGEEAVLLHGEAVGLGLIAASACAAAMGLSDAAMVEQVRGAMASAGLPTAIAGLPSDEALLDAMAHDKKQRSSTMRLILPTRVGACCVSASPPIEAVHAAWSAIRAR